MLDGDSDGVLAWGDCDDNDASLGALSADGDCDGVLTADDCDDTNGLVSEETGSTSACAASSCLDILNSGASTGSGAYYLKAEDGGTYQSYCEMTIDGGGWSLALKAWNGDTKHFYNSESHSRFEDSSTIAPSFLNLDPGDHKSLAYTSVEGEQLLAIDLNDHAHYVYADVSNGEQTLLEHILDAQDGRWEGGANGCGIMLDNLFLSQGSSTVIGSIPVEHFGLMCTDDEQSNGWSNHSDDSVYLGFLPRAAHGDQTRSHHSGIGKWANDGGDDVYESSNQEYSSSSGIAILIR
ncbi:MAG: hypothetical protein CMK59_15095 [Proteobacteria bacterium]|nr:hypothetical protein [Pseudomonadota bacterium]